MTQRSAQLRAHQQNIERYQRLLNSNLSEVELQFVEQRLSEERFALAMLQFMSSSDAKKNNLPDALQ